jgi:hypothetical protein
MSTVPTVVPSRARVWALLEGMVIGDRLGPAVPEVLVTVHALPGP